MADKFKQLTKSSKALKREIGRAKTFSKKYEKLKKREDERSEKMRSRAKDHIHSAKRLAAHIKHVIDKVSKEF